MRFSKMHGAGNDFIVLDLRDGAPPPTSAQAALMADRHFGIGCDQLLSIESSTHADCVAAYRIWNSDGSNAEQCGNGARCIAAWIQRDKKLTHSQFKLQSPAGVISVQAHKDGTYELAMGRPDFRPTAIPLQQSTQQQHYSSHWNGRTWQFGAASMGNPHALIVVDDIDQAPVHELGPALQQSDLFSQSVNVGFAQILSRTHIKLRVFERGAGETLACGSGASAAVAILIQQGLVDRQVQVQLPGGLLEISWPDENAQLSMRGPATFVFEGEWNA
jgi:diaminopimelate epimerase